jgi:hypothetical protein
MRLFGHGASAMDGWCVLSESVEGRKEGEWACGMPHHLILPVCTD